MFITDDDVVDIKVYYRKIKHTYKAYTEKEFKELKLDEEKVKKFEVLTVSMTVLNFGLYNELQEEALVNVGNGDRQFNFKIYKEGRLKKLIKKWDAKGKEGKIAPINEVAISKMAPVIAEAILRGYDEASFLSEEEEKNL